jgi:uncharacterized RDD family membrane protein YckC
MSRSVRFFNFLIDSFVFMLLVFISALILKNHVSRDVLYRILIATYYLYYFISELAIGQTIGKFITKTKVVGINDEVPSFWNVLIRTLLRMFPFDFISYLLYSQGIHDKFSKTKLIKL